MRSQRENTAYHEAGHAVLATLLGFEVGAATIESGDSYWGVATHKAEDGALDYEGGNSFLWHISDAVGALDRLGHVLARARRELAVAESSESDDDVRSEEPTSALARLLRDGEDELERVVPEVEAITRLVNNPWLLKRLQRDLDEAHHRSLIMVSMAGQAVECILDDREEPDWEGGSGSDRESQFDTQFRLLELLGDVETDVSSGERVPTGPLAENSYLDALWERTLHELRRPERWRAVEKVKAALVKDITVEGGAVRGLVREAEREMREEMMKEWRRR